MNSASSSPRYQRNFGLDLLRSVAISIVLLNHGYLGFFVSNGLSQWTGWRAALSACAVFSIEWLFVLSGFLIGSMMIRSFEARGHWWASARDFWLRRWFRTVPNYYLFLAVNAMLTWWGIEKGVFSWSFALFSQNLLSAQVKPLFFSEAWSLALDEWFYFAMPLLVGAVAWLGRLDQRQRFWVAAGLLVAVPTVLRTLVPPSLYFFEWDDDIRRVTIMHLDATGWGVIAAILSRWHPQWWARRQAAKALLGLALTLGAAAAMFYFMLVDWRGFAGGRFNDLALISAPGLGTVLFLPWLASRNPVSVAARWVAARIGDYSYSVYLCHYPLVLLIVHLAQTRAWAIGDIVGWLVLAWVAVVLLLSALVFHGFEKPTSDLRERFTRRVQAGPFSARAKA